MELRGAHPRGLKVCVCVFWILLECVCVCLLLVRAKAKINKLEFIGAYFLYQFDKGHYVCVFIVVWEGRLLRARAKA